MPTGHVPVGILVCIGYVRYPKGRGEGLLKKTRKKLKNICK